MADELLYKLFDNWIELKDKKLLEALDTNEKIN